ncbi:preprotein translocase subunit SecE [Pseudobutyrivibrio ruminis]|uniref:Preprotein translocase subunit SecE n=1 Tax=Pseudobutyrivibrio ruminis TaxID=46206 RepID=A0A1H7JF18_9FIRM|nr:preprotein translocase subunit SecE [Pseudobutyrivibrio ruminis]SEK71985.1 preprotein translocase subunit SecE [Pseudobutyrivibrio ruminis]
MAEEKKTKSGRFAGLKTEFEKIVWADPKDVSKQTTAVVAVSVVVAVIIIVLDALINKGVNILVNL